MESPSFRSCVRYRCRRITVPSVVAAAAETAAASIAAAALEEIDRWTTSGWSCHCTWLATVVGIADS